MKQWKGTLFYTVPMPDTGRIADTIHGVICKVWMIDEGEKEEHTPRFVTAILTCAGSDAS